MNEIDVTLPCGGTTKYSNLINQEDGTFCQNCSFKHYLNINEIIKIPGNKEKILKKEIEILLERFDLNNLNQLVEKKFDEITFQIDIHSEILIQKINKYRIELQEKVKRKRNEIISQVEKTEINNKISKKLFIEELEKDENLFDKSKTEEKIIQKLTEKEKIENEIKDEINKYKFLQNEKNFKIEAIFGYFGFQKNLKEGNGNYKKIF
ncbi:unnamed protein product [Brachionus calyciflorus]|uniref:Uncharacterized protein n=1 Tax=Brachionus calyciflorus TaxID=104777 RepID=A0A813VYB4_9BILA|nr:unnamed protein product [Brachionus calyciflorus]